MDFWTWSHIYARLLDAPAGRLCGVPRGGQIIAGLTGRAVDTPKQADAIVDDVLDSGETRTHYVTLYQKPFWTLAVRRSAWIQFPWEVRETQTDMEDTVRRQLAFIGEDVQRPGLRETPARVIRALRELTAGYQQDMTSLLAVTFEEPCDALVLVRDMPFASLCEHHMLPFLGTATVGYLPREGRIIGLSKIPRVVQVLARRLQVQERLTSQIATTLETALDPLGVGVLLRGTHACMALRGVKSSGEFVTSALLGVFRDPAPRAEFFAMAR